MNLQSVPSEGVGASEGCDESVSVGWIEGSIDAVGLEVGLEEGLSVGSEVVGVSVDGASVGF